jgi:hypothetical protein
LIFPTVEISKTQQKTTKMEACVLSGSPLDRYLSTLTDDDTLDDFEPLHFERFSVQEEQVEEEQVHIESHSRSSWHRRVQRALRVQRKQRQQRSHTQKWLWQYRKPTLEEDDENEDYKDEKEVLLPSFLLLCLLSIALFFYSGSLVASLAPLSLFAAMYSYRWALSVHCSRRAEQTVSLLFTELDRFDTRVRRLLSHVEDVQLVQLGYRVGSRGVSMPPVSRLERRVAERLALLDWRRSMIDCLRALGRAFDQCQLCDGDVRDDDDGERGDDDVSIDTIRLARAHSTHRRSRFFASLDDMLERSLGSVRHFDVACRRLAATVRRLRLRRLPRAPAQPVPRAPDAVAASAGCASALDKLVGDTRRHMHVAYGYVTLLDDAERDRAHDRVQVEHARSSLAAALHAADRLARHFESPATLTGDRSDDEASAPLVGVAPPSFDNSELILFEAAADECQSGGCDDDEDEPVHRAMPSNPSAHPWFMLLNASLDRSPLHAVEPKLVAIADHDDNDDNDDDQRSESEPPSFVDELRVIMSKKKSD